MEEQQMQLPKPEVRGVGTVTNPKTGEVMQIWLGKPPEVKPQPETKE